MHHQGDGKGRVGNRHPGVLRPSTVCFPLPPWSGPTKIESRKRRKLSRVALTTWNPLTHPPVCDGQPNIRTVHTISVSTHHREGNQQIQQQRNAGSIFCTQSSGDARPRPASASIHPATTTQQLSRQLLLQASSRHASCVAGAHARTRALSSTPLKLSRRAPPALHGPVWTRARLAFSEGSLLLSSFAPCAPSTRRASSSV